MSATHAGRSEPGRALMDTLAHLRGRAALILHVLQPPGDAGFRVSRQRGGLPSRVYAVGLADVGHVEGCVVGAVGPDVCHHLPDLLGRQGPVPAFGNYAVPPGRPARRPLVRPPAGHPYGDAGLLRWRRPEERVFDVVVPALVVEGLAAPQP